MRFTSFSLWLALTATLTATTGCGNSKKTTENLPPLDLPPIVQGPANPVSYAEGELLNGFAFANDASNNRIIIADAARGIMAVDATTKAVSVLMPLGQQNTADTVYLQKVTDIALNEAQNLLYVLDTGAKKIFTLDLTTNVLSVIAKATDFTIGEKFIWSAPTKIVFDKTRQRLLIADASGLQNAPNPITAFNAFALYAYSLETKAISVVMETENLASPLLFRSIQSVYLDEINNRIFTSGVSFPTGTATTAVQSVDIISLTDWSRKPLFIGTTTIPTSNQQHAATYSNASNTVYFLESNSGNILSIDLADTNPKLNYKILVNNNLKQDYSLLTPTALTQVNDAFWVYDRSAKTVFSVDKATGTRSIVFNGAPITPSVFSRPIFPTALGIDPYDKSLFISDAMIIQRDALTLTDSGFGKYAFTVDLTGITGLERTLTAPAEGETIAPITISEPKILLSQITPLGALITFNEIFEKETNNELVRNVYLSAFYKRAAAASKAVPLNTYVSEGLTRILDLSVYFSGINSTNIANQVTDFAASDSEILIILNGNQLRLLNYVTTDNDEKIKFVGDMGPYTPAKVSGATINPNNGEFLLMDVQHDALLGLGFDDKKVPTLRAISGRETASDNFLAAPSGLAFNATTNTAYTFENQSKSVIAIDVTNGKRTRLNSAVNYIQTGGKIALSADNKKLYIIDSSVRRIVEFDLASHEQRWIDRF
ncbi:MAG: hypothetical protein U5M23_02355 [Marinagarivorans sp.]|nr:hypothetical protein [Marinagarivorans sp.]